MSASDSVTQWIDQLKEGEHDAARQLLERYFQRLILLARKKLQILPGLDAYDEDVALSAFKSLCLGAERGRFPRLLDRDDLWSLLAVLTIRKAIDLLRRREPAEAYAEPNLDQLLSREPPPEMAAEMADEYERLLNRLEEPDLRAIALWKVEGWSNDEIAGRLGCAMRTVERKLQRIRIQWSEEVPS